MSILQQKQKNSKSKKSQEHAWFTTLRFSGFGSTIRAGSKAVVCAC